MSITATLIIQMIVFLILVGDGVVVISLLILIGLELRKLRAAHDDPHAKLAIDSFTNSVRRVVGGMIALHGIDALVFTGGIGEHDPATRDVIAAGQSVPVHVIPAEEDLIIAVHVAQMLANGYC